MLLFVPGNVWSDYQSPNITITGRQRDTAVTFIGYSSPDAFITFQEDGLIIGTQTTNSGGVFNKSFTARTPGTHSYGIYATDSHSRLTPTYGFILNLISNNETVVSNILLPTTIDVSTVGGVNVFGQSTPNSGIQIFVHSNPINGNVNADGGGDWNFPTGPIDQGGHTAYATSSLPGGLQSIQSNTINFNVTCKVADLNCDGTVNIFDFSILMYYWGTTNATADINQDAIVDLTDFSIMMFYWEG